MDDDMRELLKDDFTVMVMAVALTAMLGFGIANWSDQCMPQNVPTRTANDSEVSYATRISAWEKEVESVGQKAVVSKPTAVAMTLGSAMGLLMCLAVLAKRHAN